MTLAFFIPGAPASPNRWGRTTRARMARVKAERDKAYLYALAAFQHQKITGPCRIRFTVHRVRLLDPMVNLPASCKAVQDGTWKALLPLGDGPDTPYIWEPVRQVKVAHRREEGVRVELETLDGSPAIR